MDLRHVTPPADIDQYGYEEDTQCTGGSASTDNTFIHSGWSPETAITTPPRSPNRLRDNGSRLLPKPRYQDQLQEPSVGSFHGHCRTASLPSNAFSMQFGPCFPQQDSSQRSTSPYAQLRVLSSTPAQRPTGSGRLGVSRPSIANMRSVSSSHISNVRTHSRNPSSSSVDASMLSRYGYPTYRESPTPQPMSAPVAHSHSRTASAMSHLAPIAIPSAEMQPYPSHRATASPPTGPSRLSVEADVPAASGIPSPTSTVLDYLTAPNPTPSLVEKAADTSKLQASHFWFDIRNLRSWDDFNMETVSSIPGLLNLLNVDVSIKSLPGPRTVNLTPEHAGQLAELCAMHHAIKVNAALKVAQGDKHMAMRALRTAPGARQQPEFVASYQSDGEKTIYGDGRGRVVGIVKTYDQWNSGYRKGDQNRQVDYLEPLAQLHRFMREHGTRYGFIMTEIELVCVRAGGPPTEDGVPLFGYLEVAAPIQISTSGRNPDGSPRMTADLALWYLHMLAKEHPFPGQPYWRMDVGGPTALTRRHHLPRDRWMPEVKNMDKRRAKRARGWVEPHEALHKRECVKTGRKKRAGS